VPVPDGASTVQFTFDPSPYRTGRRVSVIALVAFVAAAGLVAWRSLADRGRRAPE
jgi:hypothetical protein